MLAVLAGFVVWLAEHTFLGRWISPPSQAQQAVDTERREAQAVVDSPDQAEAVRELRRGDV